MRFVNGPPVRRLVRASAGLVLSFSLGCGSSSFGQPRNAGAAQPGSTMKRGVIALANLMPLAFEPASWNEPGVAQAAEDSVKALREAAEDLDRHAGQADVGSAFLRQNLVRETAELEQDIARKRYASASERTVRLTETCMACHARLPAESQDRFTGVLFGRVNERALSPIARAELQAATRQFDAALETYEGQFVDPFSSGRLLEMSEIVPEYLILVLRVRRDPDRARRGLATLAQRSDLSPLLRRNVEIWQETLLQVGPELHGTASLESARTILKKGGGLNDFPWQGAEAVHSIVASSLLYRYIEEQKPRGEDLAEALYLLARSDAFTFRSFKLLEPQEYLEQAIRIAPHTNVAARAYAVLELEVVLINQAFEQPIPENVKTWLEELRELSRVAAVEPSASDTR